MKRKEKKKGHVVCAVGQLHFVCLNKNGLIQHLSAQFHSILKLKVEVSKSLFVYFITNGLTYYLHA